MHKSIQKETMKVKAESVYRVQEERILFTELGDEGVIYDMGKNDYFSLNETYCSIFLKIRKGLGMAGIVQELVEEYAVDQATCEKEVRDVIQELMKRGFIHEVVA
ncbi:hypothetical protein B879_03993 [Cecembia lonarensis LW9]|uniref:Coenzyme PQQ synthesis protein D (PqqD) n=2 Tax=Cecembia TaxID=1187078 RepID=K1L5R9_CECL9|nr:hypothetical protein B879_03993 [Cecembia lonarensis LW9]